MGLVISACRCRRPAAAADAVSADHVAAARYLCRYAALSSATCTRLVGDDFEPDPTTTTADAMAAGPAAATTTRARWRERGVLPRLSDADLIALWTSVCKRSRDDRYASDRADGPPIPLRALANPRVAHLVVRAFLRLGLARVLNTPPHPDVWQTHTAWEVTCWRSPPLAVALLDLADAGAVELDYGAGTRRVVIPEHEHELVQMQADAVRGVSHAARDGWRNKDWVNGSLLSRVLCSAPAAADDDDGCPWSCVLALVTRLCARMPDSALNYSSSPAAVAEAASSAAAADAAAFAVVLRAPLMAAVQRTAQHGFGGVVEGTQHATGAALVELLCSAQCARDDGSGVRIDARDAHSGLTARDWLHAYDAVVAVGDTHYRRLIPTHPILAGMRRAGYWRPAPLHVRERMHVALARGQERVRAYCCTKGGGLVGAVRDAWREQGHALHGVAEVLALVRAYVVVVSVL